MDIPEPNITCLGLPWLIRQRPLYWFLTAFYGLILMKKYKADIILNYNIFPHGFNAMLASVLSRKPAIFSEINEDTMIYYQKKISHQLVKKIISNAKVICVPGQNTANFWKSNGFDKTVQLHSTIDTNVFTPPVRQEKKYDFIYVGVFDRNKRPILILDAFLEVFKKHNEATLCLIGFGALEEELKKRIDTCGASANISLVKTKDVLEYYRASRIFVMASLSEGLPCAMMEAMACGLVPVVPPVGDIHDVVRELETGYLHDNTFDNFSEKLLIAYSNAELNKQIGENAKKEITLKHSYASATRKWNELLSKFELIENKHKN